jgi:membrane protease YdiL (CAAX protease family)
MTTQTVTKRFALFARVERHPLSAYFLLAFALFWGVIPLATIAPTLPLLLGVFTPTIAALIVSGLAGGKHEVKRLLRRVLIWRVGIGWIVAAWGIPLLCGLLTLLAARLFGMTVAPQVSLLPMGVLFFVLAIGEEIGWRGYALPKLLNEHGLSPLPASLLLGMIHAVFHVPLWFAPGMTAPIYSIGSFFASSLCFGVLWTWLYRNTRGSVLIAAMFHGAVNLFGNMFYLGIPAVLLNWLMPAGYTLAAVIVIVFYRWSDYKQDF